MQTSFFIVPRDSGIVLTHSGIAYGSDIVLTHSDIASQWYYADAQWYCLRQWYCADGQ